MTRSYVTSSELGMNECLLQTCIRSHLNYFKFQFIKTPRDQKLSYISTWYEYLLRTCLSKTRRQLDLVGILLYSTIIHGFKVIKLVYY